jgi:signal transduction histidine kinase
MTLTASRKEAAQATPPDADHAALQQRLNAVESELQNSKRAHEEARRSKAEFIANISHELRTPLQTIIGFSELGASLAQSRAGHGDYADMFGDICAGGQRMLHLVNALLDVASVSSSVGSLQLQRVDLVELIDSVVSVTNSQAISQARTQAKTQAVTFDLPVSFEHPSQPVWAWVEAARMQQVLRNVLSNALRFAGAERTHVSCVDHASRGITITVHDHGPGIPADELEAVFEPFFQSSRTRDGSGGVGLGLTVCRKIMTALGGSICAANDANGGCVVRIHLPPGPDASDITPSGVQR